MQARGRFGMGRVEVAAGMDHDKQARRASLAVLIQLGCAVARSPRALSGTALRVARAMRTDTVPDSLMRRFRLSPQRLASICIRITSASRE